MLNIADIINPETGRTYREDNAAMTHKIPLGSLVEFVTTSEVCETDGLRLFVVRHGRDCDQTPLYNMSHRPLTKWLEMEEEIKTTPEVYAGWYKANHSGATTGGYSESSLLVIQLPREHARGHVCDYHCLDGTVVTGVPISATRGDTYHLNFVDVMQPGRAMQQGIPPNDWVRYDRVSNVRRA